YHLDGAYLMRSGEELVPMSEDRLRVIFTEGQPGWLEEPSLRDLSAQRVVDLLDTQAFFSLLQRPYPTTQQAVLDRLSTERLIDPSPSGFTIRRMGAVLLARRLGDFPDVTRKSARVVVYSTNSKAKTKLDQTWESGYAAGFPSLVAFVTGQLPQ